MGVDEQLAALAVTSEVDLAHALGRDAAQIGVGIKAVVGGADPDVVDVQQQIAASAPANLAKEGPFAHLVVGEGDVAGRVFQKDGAPQGGLDTIQIGADQVQRFFGIGHRKKVVGVEAFDAGPAEVI